MSTWPHSRGKPYTDVANLFMDMDYMRDNQTIAVYKIKGRWRSAWFTPPTCGSWSGGCCRFAEYEEFDTHFEAIEFAHEIVRQAQDREVGRVAKS